jgi:hypothetical protein
MKRWDTEDPRDPSRASAAADSHRYDEYLPYTMFDVDARSWATAASRPNR